MSSGVSIFFWDLDAIIDNIALTQKCFGTLVPIRIGHSFKTLRKASSDVCMIAVMVNKNNYILILVSIRTQSTISYQ